MKTVLKLLLLFGSIVYFIFAIVYFSTATNDALCQSLSVEIVDSTHATLITPAEIEQRLRKKGLHPVDRPMTSLQSLAIEQMLETDSFIRHAMCVATPGEHVRIVIEQRIPLLRIMADNGADYYIDDEGTQMAARGYEADLAIATGDITPQFAKNELRTLGQYLRTHDFWDQQVQQICVSPSHEIDLIMRVGSQVVHFGRVTNVDQKFRNLYAFYTTILPQVGWKRYTEISVVYDNQVIGKKAPAKKAF